MAKKVYTIDVNNDELRVSAKPVADKSVKIDKKEVENFGIVEINNASSTKKIKTKDDKGFEKNVISATKKSVKAQTSKVDDYFDFSFKKDNAAKTVESVAEKTVVAKKQPEKKTEKPTAKETKDVVKTIISNKVDFGMKKVEEDVNSVKFDSDAYQIVRVARIGSLFDCEKYMIV